jgi:CopG family transcriptional regulator, nickel-responsive regulator
MTLKRFGVSLEEEVLTELDRLVESERFPNRSQALRFLIRKNVVEEKWTGNDTVLGSIVIVYDHNQKELHKEITSLQHDYHCLILASQHIHIDDNNCMSILALKGRPERLENLSNKLKAVKGIKHSGLLRSGTI